jgi:uncharacterized protein (DUF433 family)
VPTTRPAKIDIYAGKDPRDVPAYSVRTAAQYLRVPASTLRSWALGAKFVTASGRDRQTKPLFIPTRTDPLQFSFWNLVEAQVLATIRKDHKIKMPRVRRALDQVVRLRHQPRPLIGADFATDGVSLFVEHLGDLVDIGGEGDPQLMLQMIRATLERIERDEDGLAARIYPWVNEPDEPKLIVVDPRRSFGRPVVAGTRILASALADRFAAGDSIAQLAKDYDLPPSKVEYAVRWGTRRVGAA